MEYPGTYPGCGFDGTLQNSNFNVSLPGSPNIPHAFENGHHTLIFVPVRGQGARACCLESASTVSLPRMASGVLLLLVAVGILQAEHCCLADVCCYPGLNYSVTSDVGALTLPLLCRGRTKEGSFPLECWGRTKEGSVLLEESGGRTLVEQGRDYARSDSGGTQVGSDTHIVDRTKIGPRL